MFKKIFATVMVAGLIALPSFVADVSASSPKTIDVNTMSEDLSYKSSPSQLYYPGYDGSPFYRIPALAKLSDGTMIAGVDQRNTTEADWGDIDMVIRRKLPGESEYGDPIKVLDLKEEGANQPGFAIDMVLLPVSHGEHAGRLYMFADVFKSGGSYWASQKGKGYINIDGQDCLALTNVNTGEKYFVYEGNIYDWNSQDTGMTFQEIDDQPFTNIGDVYKDGQYLGNVYQDISELQVHQTPYIWMTYSDDNGLSWSNPVDITPQIKDDNMYFLGTGPGRGLQLESGRLVVPMYYTTSSDGRNRFESTVMIYSDDYGKTWHRGKSPNDYGANNSLEAKQQIETSENQIVQLNNGNLLTFMRNRNSGNSLKYAISTDEGHSWGNTVYNVDFTSTPTNNLSVVKYDRDGKEYVILSNAKGPGRNNGFVKVLEVLEDSTVRTIGEKRINSAAYSYSSMEETNIPGRFGLMYEVYRPYQKTNDNRTSIYYTEFDYDWLLDDNQTEVANYSRLEELITKAKSSKNRKLVNEGRVLERTIRSRNLNQERIDAESDRLELLLR